MSYPDDAPDAPVAPAFAAAIVDIFVYVLVLNLFVEYVRQVIRAAVGRLLRPSGQVTAA